MLSCLISYTRRKAALKSGLRILTVICALAVAVPVPAGSDVNFDSLPPDTGLTRRHWVTARDYQRQMRYELARQHYVLALAACRNSRTQAQLKRELEGVDLQIRSMR